MREILPLLPKPAYYACLEHGAVRKNPRHVTLRIALAFPDTYEVGMSYLGHKILYEVINDNPDWWAERVMLPDNEAASLLRAHKLPLATLESDTPLKDLDLVGFAVTHELCFTDVLHMLDLADIPLRAGDRPEDLQACPVIMAGGGAMLGAEAIAPFFDLVALGDGEESLPEILRLLEKCVREHLPRSRFLELAAKIHGVYIPAFFEHDAAGNLRALAPGYRPKRRIVEDLDRVPYPARQITPIGAVHNRLSLEIARGCTRGCRFCHAGYAYRPPRERNIENLKRILDECLDATGFEEVSFLSLSAGDYSALRGLYHSAWDRCAREQISLALPSLRVGSIEKGIMAKMAALRRTGMTLAPEAATQRLRDSINKGITEDQLLEHVRALSEYGWRQIKLYFMIGLPGETDEDLQAIYDLCLKVRAATAPDRPKMQITAAVSTFVPKPFTPFQWEAQADLPEIRRKIGILKNLFDRHKFLTLRWHDPEVSHLEGILSRADRRMADVVEKAYRKGAVYCAWKEFFSLAPWLEAMAECGLQISSLIGSRTEDGPLPWDHLESGVSRDFLLREKAKALKGQPTPDCRYGACSACGVCDRPGNPSRLGKAPGHEHYHCRLVNADRDQENPAEEDQKFAAPVRNKPCSAQRYQYRLWHKKLGAHVWLSQLDMQALLERVFRRGHIALAFSQGFHPLPLISFGRALPVGLESHAEWIAISLEEDLAGDTLLQRLNRELPSDLALIAVEKTDRKGRNRVSLLEDFRLLFKREEDLDGAAKKFADFFSATEVLAGAPGKKGDKIVNLRQFLGSWQWQSPLALEFRANWQNGYISPVRAVNHILGIGGARIDPAYRLIKLAQHFEAGKSFGETAQTRLG